MLPSSTQTLWDAVQQQLTEHRANGSDRPKGTMPNLLAGLLHDETGDRLVPSHAVKSGKRYRYYVSARLITGSRSDAPDGMRVPAAEVESGVIERIRRFLTNGASVFEALQHLEPDVGRVQQLMRRAREIADTLQRQRTIRSRGNAAEIDLPHRGSIGSDQHRYSTGRIACPATWANRGDGSAPFDAAMETGVPFVLTVPLARRRAGRDTRLLIDRPGATQADPALVRVLVRAHAFKAKLLRSGEASLTETSRTEGISRSYLTRLARLAFLAPEIVCAILDGRQPAQLTAARLIRFTRLPLDWSEQRKVLGFG